METNVNYTLVGAFVIVLVAALVFSIIWISSGFSFEKYTTYLIYMQESVSGLSTDSSVEYNGVGVGSVKSIELNHKNPQMVEVLVNINTSTPITRGTVATLTTRGLTGVVYIALKDKSTDLHPLTAQGGMPYPVIPTAPSIFMRLDTALTQLNSSFQKISNTIASVLDKQNQDSIKSTLSNLKQITGNLAINSRKLDRLLDTTTRASESLTPLLTSGTNAMRLLELQTLPAAYRLLTNLDTMSLTLTGIANDVKQNPSVLIRGKSQPVLGPGETK